MASSNIAAQDDLHLAHPGASTIPEDALFQDPIHVSQFGATRGRNPREGSVWAARSLVGASAHFK